MTVWKRAIALAAPYRHLAEWEIQEAVFTILEQYRAARGWTEQECVDAARWAARKVKEQELDEGEP